MNEYCTWREDEDGLWWTTCKEAHVFFDGTPTENSYKFCPYCGKEIVEFKYKRDEAYDRLMSTNSVSKNDIEIVLDGDAWCAYRKPFRNLQEDDAGFGDTPQMALTALLESELPDGWEAM